MGKKLVIAPRRLAGVESAEILARYFPGLELELDCTELVFLSDVLDDESFDGLQPVGFGLIIAVVSFEHVRRPALLASTVLGALEPGGGFLASVPFAMPLHEIDRDFWRFAPQGLAALLEDAGFSDVEVADSGEEEHWDVIGNMPGLVKAWMPYPRVCFTLCRKPADGSGETEHGGSRSHALLQDVAYGQEFVDLLARIDDFIITVKALEEQGRNRDAYVRKVEADNAAKHEELEKVAPWALRMESELIALLSEGGPAPAEPQQQPDAKPSIYIRMRSLAGRVLRKLHLRK